MVNKVQPKKIQKQKIIKKAQAKQSKVNTRNSQNQEEIKQQPNSDIQNNNLKRLNSRSQSKQKQNSNVIYKKNEYVVFIIRDNDDYGYQIGQVVSEVKDSDQFVDLIRYYHSGKDLIFNSSLESINIPVENIIELLDINAKNVVHLFKNQLVLTKKFHQDLQLKATALHEELEDMESGYSQLDQESSSSSSNSSSLISDLDRDIQEYDELKEELKSLKYNPPINNKNSLKKNDEQNEIKTRRIVQVDKLTAMGLLRQSSKTQKPIFNNSQPSFEQPKLMNTLAKNSSHKLRSNSRTQPKPDNFALPMVRAKSVQKHDLIQASASSTLNKNSKQKSISNSQQQQEEIKGNQQQEQIKKQSVIKQKISQPKRTSNRNIKGNSIPQSQEDNAVNMNEDIGDNEIDDDGEYKEEIEDEEDIVMIDTSIKKKGLPLKKPKQQAVGEKRKRQKAGQGDKKEVKVVKRRKVGVKKDKPIKVKQPRVIKRPIVFKLGKWNPDIEIIEINKHKDEKCNELRFDCCVRCNNRNAIRSVITEDQDLLIQCILDSKRLSNFMAYWSVDQQVNILDLIVQTGNQNLLQVLFFPQKFHLDQNVNWSTLRQYRVHNPNYLLQSTDSGMVSNMAYGRKVRRVQMTRGNRQGNNAFLRYPDNDHLTPYEGIASEPFIAKLLASRNVDLEFIQIMMKSDNELEAKIQEQVYQAVRAGNYRLAYKIIEKMVQFPNFGFGQLHLDVLSDDNRDIEKVLKQSVTKKAIQSKNITPLDCACINPNSKYLKLLLDAQPEINIKDLDYKRPVHYAAACENAENLELLIFANANIGDEDNDKRNCLHIAAINGRHECVRVILNSRPNLIKCKDKFGMNAMGYACQKGHVEVVKVLIEEFKAKKNAGCGVDRIPPLSIAAANGHLDLVKYLLDKKARVLSKDKYKRTPLILAVQNGESQIASLLLQYGSDWEHQDSSSNTPLHYAAAYGWIDCIDLLLKAGADVNEENSWKITPVNIAMLKHHKGCVKRLIQEEGVNLNVKDEQGQTLLMLTLKTVFTEEVLDFVEFLLGKGADPNLQNLQGKTAIHLIASYAPRREDNSYAQITAEDSKSQKEIQFNLIQLLMKHGADLSIKDNNQHSAFEFALASDNFQIIDIFMDSVSFNANPALMTQILNQCLKVDYQIMFKKIAKKDTLTNATLTYFDTQEQPLFMKAVQVFIYSAHGYRSVIQEILIQQSYTHMTNFDNYSVTNEMIFDKYRQRTQHYYEVSVRYMTAKFEELISYFHTECIVKPYIEFLQYLIDLGFDPKAQTQDMTHLNMPMRILSQTEEILYKQAQNQHILLQQGLNEVNITKKDLKDLNFNDNQLEIAKTFLIKHTQQQMNQYYNYYQKNVGRNSFHIVNSYPHELLINFLFEQGIDYDLQDSCGQTPFIGICMQNNISNDQQIKKFYEQLLARNIKLEPKTFDGKTPFLRLYERQLFTEAFHLVDKLGANINTVDYSGNFALKLALMKKDINSLKQLLDRGANINTVDDKGRNLLHLAINMSNTSADASFELEQFLIDQGIDINKRDHRGRVPLHYAFVKIRQWNSNQQIDPIEAVSSLCGRKGLEVDVPDIWLKTPLHYAAQRGASICSLYLINRGAQLENQDIYGNTPLGVGLQNRHFHYGIILIQKLASVLPPINNENQHYPNNIWQSLQQQVIAVFEQKQKELLENITNSQDLIDNVEEKKKEINEKEKDNDIEMIDTTIGKKNNLYSQINESETKENKSKRGYKFVAVIVDEEDEEDENNETKKDANKNNNLEEDLLFKDFLLKLKGNNSFFANQQGISMFKHALSNGQQGLAYLLLDNGYDLMLAIQDAIDENKFMLVLTLLSKISNDEIVQRKNSKKQNLFHIIGMHASRCQSDILGRILTAFRDRGVDYNAQDYQDKTPLHYTVAINNIQMINFLLKLKDINVDPLDFNQNTPLTQCMQNGIGKLSTVFKYYDVFNSLAEAGANMNHIYREPTVRSKYVNLDGNCELYTTTLIIQLYRNYTVKGTMNENLDTLIEYGARVDKPDADGRDIFIYAVIDNNLEVVKKLLDTFDKNQILREHHDKFGKSHAHYLVNPRDYGTYDNVELLRLLFENGFDINMPDKNSKTPMQYAAEQTGLLYDEFKTLLNIDENIERPQLMEEVEEQWPEFVYDFNQDAKDYVEEKDEEYREQQESVKPIVPPDQTGNFEKHYKVYYDENENPWDVYLTKIDLQNGLYGDYVFYKMQLLHDTNRDLYVVFTRWGRIGEPGMNQRTPFNNIEEAKTDFKKIFAKKTGNNDFENLEAFQRAPKKYNLAKIKYTSQYAQNYFKNIDYDKVPQTVLNEQVFQLLKDLGSIHIYRQRMNEFGVDTDSFQMQRLSRDMLESTKKLLEDIKKVISDDEELRKDILAANYEKLQGIKEQRYKLSNQVYEIFPNKAYKDSIAPPLDLASCNRYLEMIYELTNIKQAQKIILGAQHKQNEINPVDYIYNILNCKIDVLDKCSPEFNTLLDYINKSANLNQHSIDIFKLSRKGENERIQAFKNTTNHHLLFHGSGVYNFLGILSQGLLIAPPDAPVTGYNFGKGLYFADKFSKSSAYSSRGFANKRYLLICEVVLGESKQLTNGNFIEKLEEPFLSVKGVGHSQPDPNQQLLLPDGTIIPFGKSIPVPYQLYWSNDNEFIVYNEAQVRMKYLIRC